MAGEDEVVARALTGRDDEQSHQRFVPGGVEGTLPFVFRHPLGRRVRLDAGRDVPLHQRQAGSGTGDAHGSAQGIAVEAGEQSGMCPGDPGGTDGERLHVQVTVHSEHDLRRVETP
ncbi:hypothetical protein [Streptomyces xanthochromogenes]|uniref:hypothetical protein n=1 Tax=Streptomyces xanthochromogenes TaxID=67384 RepID=UPI00142394E5